jgi:hypothetical protein
MAAPNRSKNRPTGGATANLNGAARVSRGDGLHQGGRRRQHHAGRSCIVETARGQVQRVGGVGAAALVSLDPPRRTVAK